MSEDERAYVSRLWAEDWDSPEDSVYDQAPIDWPARFRAAASVAAKGSGVTIGLSVALYEAARQLDEVDPDVVEAIGRALLGEDS